MIGPALVGSVTPQVPGLVSRASSCVGMRFVAFSTVNHCNPRTKGAPLVMAKIGSRTKM